MPLPLKRMVGIDEWGARTHLCVPIGAHMGTPQKGKKYAMKPKKA
jgi:hypothetical protein